MAGSGQSPPPSPADSAHSLIMANLSPGAVEAVKQGRMAKQEGKSPSGLSTEAKISLRALLLVDVHLTSQPKVHLT